MALYTDLNESKLTLEQKRDIQAFQNFINSTGAEVERINIMLSHDWYWWANQFGENTDAEITRHQQAVSTYNAQIKTAKDELQNYIDKIYKEQQAALAASIASSQNNAAAQNAAAQAQLKWAENWNKYWWVYLLAAAAIIIIVVYVYKKVK